MHFLKKKSWFFIYYFSIFAVVGMRRDRNEMVKFELNRHFIKIIVWRGPSNSSDKIIDRLFPLILIKAEMISVFYLSKCCLNSQCEHVWIFYRVKHVDTKTSPSPRNKSFSSDSLSCSSFIVVIVRLYILFGILVHPIRNMNYKESSYQELRAILCIVYRVG